MIYNNLSSFLHPLFCLNENLISEAFKVIQILILSRRWNHHFLPQKRYGTPKDNAF